MARLQYVVLAEYARVDAGGLLTVAGAGFDRIVVNALPGQVPLACAMRVLLAEPEKDARLAVALRPPSGVGLRLETVLTPPPEAKSHEGLIGVAFAATFGLPVSSPGTYVLEVSVDDAPAERISFEVEVQRPPGQADV
ncbi:hypothetical protein SSP531S_29430 [Streptomyces spongiicola]|uniref:Uncharacterized protein n=1 Tax=Streptomyces spongiicola TaxID=1690221 RepID=A0A2S1Z3P1_9ACTN|nr:hypothetical protein [Streptomyces spongiicola]AWK10951.1 hypothetical protein DDQ41_20845 [Streptomyces spongiicola]GBQ01509.1 hypothetical protein SSP531S_29430 [Streptomyces spongiicola]